VLRLLTSPIQPRCRSGPQGDRRRTSARRSVTRPAGRRTPLRRAREVVDGRTHSRLPQGNALPRQVRQTKIVFTIGPATSDETTLRQLIEKGVDVCRFNMAHADHDFFRMALRRVRECCAQVGRRIAFLMDVKGPEIRTRDVPASVELEQGDMVEFFYQPFDVEAESVVPDGRGHVRWGSTIPTS